MKYYELSKRLAADLSSSPVLKSQDVPYPDFLRPESQSSAASKRHEL